MEYPCPKCFEKNPVATGFCRRCGASLGAAPKRNRAIPVFLIAVVAMAALIFFLRNSNSAPSPTPAPPPPQSRLKLTIAYGTEKTDWLKYAAAEFAKTPQGQNIDLDLQGKGSLEAAQSIVADAPIHIWSPASSLYKNVFLRDWQTRHPNTNPISREADLALTPMVFVMWNQRHEAFLKKYGEASFVSLSKALNESSGWDAIAAQPDWGFFKFSHTHPNRSNSGLATLLLMACDHSRKTTGLSPGDLTGRDFQQWMTAFETKIVGAANPNEQLSPSTGTLMTWMIQRGPSTYDAIFVYESVAIERLKVAQGRWGDLRVVYPKYNYWNTNPCYILDTPATTPAHKKAANDFLNFLLTDAIQAKALEHGFRPANLSVPTNTPSSPLVEFSSAGLKADVPGQFCDTPAPETLENLLLSWQRSVGGR